MGVCKAEHQINWHPFLFLAYGAREKCHQIQIINFRFFFIWASDSLKINFIKACYIDCRVLLFTAQNLVILPIEVGRLPNINR